MIIHQIWALIEGKNLHESLAILVITSDSVYKYDDKVAFSYGRVGEDMTDSITVDWLNRRELRVF